MTLQEFISLLEELPFLKRIDRSCLIDPEKEILFRLSETSYIVRVNHYWLMTGIVIYLSWESQGYYDEVYHHSFEEVLDKAPPEIQEQLLYHLNLWNW